jgi:hypothetical protein
MEDREQKNQSDRGLDVCGDIEGCGEGRAAEGVAVPSMAEGSMRVESMCKERVENQSR